MSRGEQRDSEMWVLDCVSFVWLSDFKQHDVLSYSCGRPESKMGFSGLKPRCWKNYTPSGDLGESVFPCFFLLLESISWFMVPSFIFKAGSMASSNRSLFPS